MITEWTMYWLTRLDSLKGLFVGLSTAGWIVGSIGVIICLLVYASEKDDDRAYGIHDPNRPEFYIKLKYCKRWFISILISGLVFGVINAALPTTKEMVAIKVVPMIANNQDIQGLGTDIIQLARDWLKELSPEKKEETTTEQPK